MNDFRYDNENDAYQQLNRTVVPTKSGILYYIRAISINDWLWKVLALGDLAENAETIDIRELGITFSPLQLGYCNHEDNASYLVRRPVRMWKQGLSSDHIKAKSGWIMDGLMHREELNNMLLNSYPSLPDCYEWVRNIVGSKAFNRDFALATSNYPKISLEYKGEIIGILNDNGDFEIDDEFFFVKEQLEEILNEEN